MVERAEEAERMREHVIKEMDKNKDRMISEDEFLKQVNKKTTGVQGVPSQVSELQKWVRFQQTHNCGLRQLFLTVSWDLRDMVTFYFLDIK